MDNYRPSLFHLYIPVGNQGCVHLKTSTSHHYSVNVWQQNVDRKIMKAFMYMYIAKEILTLNIFKEWQVLPTICARAI